MLEGPKVSADSMFAPRVLPLLNGSVAAGFSVAESHETPAQIRELDVEARIDNGRRGVDARRNEKPLPLEARPHDSIEANHDDTARKARDETGGNPEPDQLAKPAAPTFGRAALRLRTALRGRAALARSRFTLSRVSQQSPGGNYQTAETANPIRCSPARARWPAPRLPLRRNRDATQARLVGFAHDLRIF